MIKPLRKRLEEASKKNNLRLDIIQQDYLLSWLLVGLYQQVNLKSSLIFKGGTALKKSYFGDYRFSEDLDFSTTYDAPFESLLMDEISKACKYAEDRIYEYAPVKIFVKRYEEKIVLNDFIILLEKKCILKDVYFDGPESFFDSAMIEYVSKTWKNWLGPLVPNLPDCHKVINELKMKLEFLFINYEEKLSLILQHMIQGKLKGESLYGILKRALQKENDINTQNINGHKFLQLLIQKAKLDSRKKLELIKKVIDYGVKIDDKDKSGLTPFQVAVKNREKEIADFLLSKGARDKVPMNMNTDYYQMYL